MNLKKNCKSTRNNVQNGGKFKIQKKYGKFDVGGNFLISKKGIKNLICGKSCWFEKKNV